MGTGTAATKESIIEQLKWRYAVKKYDPTKQVSDADWVTLEEAITLAPSSLGLQPYKVIIVKDKETREKLRAVGYNQSQITDASGLVVFAYQKNYDEKDAAKFIDLIAETRGVPRESLADYEATIVASADRATKGGYIETWNSRQAYIALGFLIETAALLGIDATPMEGFDAEGFNQVLGLDEHSAVAIAAVGYRDAENDWLAPLAKVRKPNEELFVRI